MEDARRLLALFSGQNGQSAQQERLREKAEQILALRRKRTLRFSGAMFSEPAWEMLLSFYAAVGGGRLTVSKLALQSGSSKTTAARWIDYLEHQGLTERIAHPTDQRIAFVKLTQKGKQALDDYLSDVTELNG